MVDEFYQYLKNYERNCLPVEMLNSDTLKKVEIYSNILKVICCFNMVCATVAALGFITAPEYFNEKTYLSVWIQQTFPEYSNFMLLVVHWTSLPVALVMAGTSITWAYAGGNAMFQVYIFIEMLKGISKTTIPQKMRRDSEVYQSLIRQKLIMSIMAFELIVKYQDIACDILEAPLLLFSVGSIILGGSLMIEFLSNQEQNFGDQYAIYVGIFFFALAGIISANLYILFGQAIKDESENCNSLLRQLPWYDMNKENKTIYSIFLRRTEKSLLVSNSLLQIDYSLLVRIVKTLYSLAAILAQFVSSNGPTDNN
ncbi:uncharacterized protein LOC123314134 [Coccinella septempunctata]|uniref:uncharacterized protein LOC123314134 n=1 Tax=Coccinella septempunctata TaxID=41139 RepID=UPI001D08572F|nr:uncharacterized protein LOC123314134 [Coccinella septempunctata]